MQDCRVDYTTKTEGDGRVDCNQLAGWRVEWVYTLIVPANSQYSEGTTWDQAAAASTSTKGASRICTKRECSEIANRKANQ